MLLEATCLTARVLRLSQPADVQCAADCADLSDTCGMCLEAGHECLLPVLSFNGLSVPVRPANRQVCSPFMRCAESD